MDELITGERRGDTPVDDQIPGEVVSGEELITGGVERRRDASGSAHHCGVDKWRVDVGRQAHHTGGVKRYTIVKR